MGIMDFKRINNNSSNRSKKLNDKARDLSQEKLVYYYNGEEYTPFDIEETAEETLQNIIDINSNN
jgi:hypothetical protein